MPQPAPEGKSAHLLELDGLRGILALWVVMAHILCWCGFIENAPHHIFWYFWSEFLSAAAAVQVFMILSGFAISFLLHKRRQTYLQFMTGRFFRLYPVYLICLALGVGVSFLAPAILEMAPWQTAYFDHARAHLADERAAFGSQIFWHLTLLNGMVPDRILPGAATSFLPPAWSITLEWQYYLVAPLFLLLVRSPFGLLALSAAILLFNRFVHLWDESAFAFLPSQLPFFLIGIGSFHLYAWLKSRGTPSLPGSVIAIALSGALLLGGDHAIVLVVWTVAFGSILAAGQDRFSQGLLGLRRFLLLPGMQAWGRISYPVYLVHWPLLLGLLYLLLRAFPHLAGYQAALLLTGFGLPVILLAATCLHRYVELPGMALGKRKTGAMKTSGTAT